MQVRLLCLSLILTCLWTPVFANSSTPLYTSYAEKLSTIGVFQGTGTGFELDREPTRLEGLVMLIRLLGREDEALSLPNPEKPVFTDVPPWGQKYTEFAYKEGLTAGIGDGLFGAMILMDAKSYHTFLLRALGYKDGQGDFTWLEANSFIYAQGIVDQAYYDAISHQTFLRDHMARSSYGALYAMKRDGSGSLLDSLLASGDLEASAVIGLEDDQVALSEPVIYSIYIKHVDKEAEFVIIANPTAMPVDLSGWRLVSETGNQSFTFPQGFVLKGMEEVKLTSGEATGSGDFDMALSPVWNNTSSDPAVLYNEKDQEMDRLD